MGVYFTSQIYDLLNHGPAVLNLHTALDSAIPVVPVFVIPYNSLQPYIYATLLLFLFLRTKYFQSACLAMITVWFISYGFYYFLQSEVVRPVLTATDVFSKAVMNVYAGDNPTMISPACTPPSPPSWPSTGSRSTRPSGSS